MNETVHSEKPTALADKPARKKAPARAKEPSRTNDPARTMAGILEVATKEFGEKGLAGGRIDAIADATHTSKRMIYYYFGSKKGLYLAVLEGVYRDMRSIEGAHNLENLEPEEALRKLTALTFDHQNNHPNFVRLVMSENIQRGQSMAQSKFIQELNVPAIATIQNLLDRGVASGVFRSGLSALDIHASISALAFFNVSNQHTFGLIFKHNNQDPHMLAQRRANVVEMIARFVRK